MSASRKLYEKTASALKSERPASTATDAEIILWVKMVEAVSGAFLSDNANFNTSRFNEACGIPA